MEVDGPNFREGQVGIKLKKCSIFQGSQEGFLPVVPEWLQHSRFTILIQNIISNVKMEPEN